MIKHTVRRKVTTTELYELRISADAIRVAFGLPENANVIISVPGGGDWSNTDLDLDEHSVLAKWSVQNDYEEGE